MNENCESQINLYLNKNFGNGLKDLSYEHLKKFENSWHYHLNSEPSIYPSIYIYSWEDFNTSRYKIKWEGQNYMIYKGESPWLNPYVLILSSCCEMKDIMNAMALDKNHSYAIVQGYCENIFTWRNLENVTSEEIRKYILEHLLDLKQKRRWG